MVVRKNDSKREIKIAWCDKHTCRIQRPIVILKTTKVEIAICHIVIWKYSSIKKNGNIKKMNLGF